MILKCPFIQRTVTQVDRWSHSERGEDRALNLPVPELTTLLKAREHLWGAGEALKSRRVWDGEGGVAVEKRTRIYYQDLWGVSYKSPKLTFDTYEILCCHPLSSLYCLGVS